MVLHFAVTPSPTACSRILYTMKMPSDKRYLYNQTGAKDPTPLQLLQPPKWDKDSVCHQLPSSSRREILLHAVPGLPLPYSPLYASSYLLSASALAFLRRGPHFAWIASSFAFISFFLSVLSTPHSRRHILMNVDEQLNFLANLALVHCSGSVLFSL